MPCPDRRASCRPLLRRVHAGIRACHTSLASPSIPSLHRRQCPPHVPMQANLHQRGSRSTPVSEMLSVHGGLSGQRPAASLSITGPAHLRCPARCFRCLKNRVEHVSQMLHSTIYAISALHARVNEPCRTVGRPKRLMQLFEMAADKFPLCRYLSARL